MSLNQITKTALMTKSLLTGEYKGFTVLSTMAHQGFKFSVVLGLDDNSDATFVLESNYEVDTIGELKNYAQQVVDRFPYSAKKLLSLSQIVDLNNVGHGQPKTHLYDLIKNHLVHLLPLDQQIVASSCLDTKIDAISGCCVDEDLIELVDITSMLIDEGVSDYNANMVTLILTNGVRALGDDFSRFTTKAYEWSAYGPHS